MKNTLEAWTEDAPAGAMGFVFPNSIGKVRSYSIFCHRVFKRMLVEDGIIDLDGEKKFAATVLWPFGAWDIIRSHHAGTTRDERPASEKSETSREKGKRMISALGEFDRRGSLAADECFQPEHPRHEAEGRVGSCRQRRDDRASNHLARTDATTVEIKA